MAVSFLGSKNLSRGFRNNNPGNIRRTSDNWQGKIPFAQSTDTEFEQFYEINWGLRAMMKDIQNKIKGGYNTVSKIITKYAPPSENNTASYIANVVNWSGLTANQALTANKTVIIALCKAMVLMENGETSASKLTNDNYNEAWFFLETGYVYASGNIPEVVINGTTKTCKYCGHVLAVIVCFFLSYYSVIVA